MTDERRSVKPVRRSAKRMPLHDRRLEIAGKSQDADFRPPRERPLALSRLFPWNDLPALTIAAELGGCPTPVEGAARHSVCRPRPVRGRQRAETDARHDHEKTGNANLPRVPVEGT